MFNKNKELKIIKDQTFSIERSLYNIFNYELINIYFGDSEVSESPLKECNNIIIKDSKFDLRYPCWHISTLDIISSSFSNLSRAPIWYSFNIRIFNSYLEGIKALRECKNITLEKNKIISNEFSWFNKNILIKDSYIEGEYAFFKNLNVEFLNSTFKGKYSFQYSKNIIISNSSLDTKDAFWHSKNIIIKNSTIKGEYLGWYSKNITLINSLVIGSQPLCYCKNLKLINTRFINSNLAFEYSEVNGNILGNIDSIKNPIKGRLIIENNTEIIFNNSKYKSKAKIIIKK